MSSRRNCGKRALVSCGVSRSKATFCARRLLIVSASDESSFELIDLLIALRPDHFGHKIVNANNEDILIVRAIENDDLAASRRLALDPPQKIVREFFR